MVDDKHDDRANDAVDVEIGRRWGGDESKQKTPDDAEDDALAGLID